MYPVRTPPLSPPSSPRSSGRQQQRSQSAGVEETHNLASSTPPRHSSMGPMRVSSHGASPAYERMQGSSSPSRPEDIEDFFAAHGSSETATNHSGEDGEDHTETSVSEPSTATTDGPVDIDAYMDTLTPKKAENSEFRDQGEDQMPGTAEDDDRPAEETNRDGDGFDSSGIPVGQSFAINPYAMQQEDHASVLQSQAAASQISREGLLPPVDRYDDDDRNKPFHRTRNGIIVICAVLLAFLALIIALAVARPGQNRNAPPASEQGVQDVGSQNMPTPRPTPFRGPASVPPTPGWYAYTSAPTPTAGPVPASAGGQGGQGGGSLTQQQLKRYRDLYDKLVNVQAASDPNDLSPNAPASAKSTGADTPQQRALNWIAFEDELQLRADEDPSERIAQRYALAVVYFATKGNRWVDRSRWLEGPEHECTWYGLECENRQIVSHASGDVVINTEDAMVTEMMLQENNLNGDLPREVAVFRFMIKMSLYDNKLKGSLPDQIGEMSSLERMWMDNNEFQGPLPASIGKLENLIQMDIFTNGFTSLPQEIGDMKRLQRFSAYGNRIDGSLPTQMGEMESLEELFLDGNNIIGSIPDEIGNLDQLRDLRLHDNSIIGSLPSSMAKLKRLSVLYIDSNDITGSISSIIGGLDSIVDFQAFGNKLTGTLPAAIGSLKNLAVLDLNNNRMWGVLPATLGEQGTLQKLDLSKNEFNGEIPDSLGESTGIMRLHLSSNSFKGAIPAWMGSMKSMKTLMFDDNGFGGPIPEELGNLKQLLQLTLEANKLSGEVPQELCRYNLQRLSADCQGMNAPVECSCCTECCSNGVCTEQTGISAQTSRYHPGGNY